MKKLLLALSLFTLASSTKSFEFSPSVDDLHQHLRKASQEIDDTRQKFKEKPKDRCNNSPKKSLRNTIKKIDSKSEVPLSIVTQEPTGLVVFINASSQDLTFVKKINSAPGRRSGMLAQGCFLVAPADGTTFFCLLPHYDAYEIKDDAKLYVVIRDNPQRHMYRRSLKPKHR